ncbi:MAG: VanZ family protein [Duncaniella sp.]|nr:VanZ family protein [Duncaniella sp.]
MIIRLIRRVYGIIPAWLPGTLVVAAILYLTLAPRPLGDDTPELFEGADKVVHAIMFGAMSFTLALDRLMGRGAISHMALAVIAAVTVVTGLGIELLQGVMECGRSGDMADGVADIAGALAGIWIFIRVKRIIDQ